MQQRFTYLKPKLEIAPKYVFNEALDRERMRFLYNKNMPLVAYSCLCKGAYESDERLPADYTGGDRLAFIRKMAEEKGVNPSALAVSLARGS